MTKNTGFSRLFKAGYFSYKGLRYALINEAAFRQEVAAIAILMPLVFILNVSNVERVLMVASLVLVLIIELLNTSIEAVVDRIGAEHHTLAGVAKDTGSAAVLLALLLALFVWVSILL